MKTAAEFLAEHGRLPKLGDDPAPWTYPGWALPYVQHAHGQGQCPDRWGHWLNVRLAGRLIAEPIPRVYFSTSVSGPELRAVEKWLSVLVPLALAYAGAWAGLAVTDVLLLSLGQPPVRR